MTTYSLRPDVAVEPAIDGWYAWSYLLAPHCAAMLRRNHYRPMLEGYLAEPEKHAAALRDPRMQGGSFVYGEGDRYDVIASWWAKAGQENPLDRLAEAIMELETEVLPRQNGRGLAETYQELPHALRGLVELYYERDNVTADYRFLEALVHGSDYAHAVPQHVRFSFIRRDDRDFALTTPLLAFDHDQLVVDVDLGSPALDRMFAGHLAADALDALAQELGIHDEDRALFDSYFAADPLEGRPVHPAASGTRVQYAGHACVVVEHDSACVLVDPVMSYSGYEHTAGERVTFDSLPDQIDCVAISHNHQDHMLLETLLRIRHKVREVVVAESTNGSLVDPNLPLILKRLGFTVTGLREMESTDVGSMTLTSLPFIGEHGDLRIHTKSCFHLDVGGRGMAFAADATNINPGMYERVTAMLGTIDTLFIGMECVGAPVSWMYGAFFTHRLQRKLDQSRRLKGSNYEQALDIVRAMGPSEVFVYALGQEPWLGAVMCIEYDESHPAMTESSKLIEQLTSEGLRSKRLYLYEEIRAEL